VDLAFVILKREDECTLLHCPNVAAYALDLASHGREGAFEVLDAVRYARCGTIVDPQ